MRPHNINRQSLLVTDASAPQIRPGNQSFRRIQEARAIYLGQNTWGVGKTGIERTQTPQAVSKNDNRLMLRGQNQVHPRKRALLDLE